MKNDLLCVFVLALLFSSCSKNDQPQTPPVVTPDPVTTFTINLSYTPSSTPIPFELIVSTPSGTVLLDTIAATGNVISASLKAKDSLVDVTTVYFNTAFSTYAIQTYKGVNPSNWNMLISRDVYYNQIPNATKTNAHITYINLPKITIPFSLPYFDGTANSIIQGSFGTTKFDIDYQRHPTGITFLVIPDKLLCKFYTPKSNQDTVDLTQMDTAVQINFTKPSQYIINSVLLQGVLDSTDLTKSVSLYRVPGTNYTGADLVYPKKPVQQYQQYVSARDNTKKDDVIFFSYGNSIISNLTFPDESYYSITKNQYSDFSVNFLNTPPAYYKTTWVKTGISWTIYASPGTTQLQPQTLLNSFHSQLLKNTDLSNLTLSTFNFEITPLLNYSKYLEYALTTGQNRPRLIYSSSRFTKTF